MRLPATVGPYRVERELGRGNYGVVYLVEGAEGDPFALKVLLAGERDAEARTRFRLEGHVISKLDHPGLIGLIDAGVHEGHPYLVMEYCAGSSLYRRLKQGGPLLPGDAAAMVAAMSEAVASAHALGVLHRDLKAENVLLDPRTGAPRITDFGLALDDRITGITKTGEVMGTPSHMAPEQLAGEELDERVDVYALGVILYECLTGKLPYDAEDLPSLVSLIRGGRARPPSAWDPNVPPELDDVCLRALAANREERTASAAQLADELRGFVEGGPGPLARGRSPSLTVALFAVGAGVVAVLAGGGWLWRARAVRAEEQAARLEAEALRQRAAEKERAQQRAAEEAERRRVAEREARLREVELALEEAWSAHRGGRPQDEVDRRFEEALALAADLPRWRARILCRRASSDRRRGRYQRVLDALPALVGSEYEHRARYLAGMSQFRLEKPEEARRLLEETVRGEPDGVWGLCAGAFLAYAMEGDAVRGEQLARRALELDPQGVDPLLCLAFALSNQSRPQEALPYIERAVGRAPDQPRGWFAKGFILYSLGDRDGALAQFARTVELTEPRPMLQALLLHSQLSLESGRLEDALRSARRVLEQAPGHTHSRIVCGRILLARGKPLEAKLEFAEAWRRDPAGTEALLPQLPPGEADALRASREPSVR